MKLWKMPRLSPVSSREFGRSKNVALHCLLDFLFGDAGLEVQHLVQRIEFEKVAMRFAWRRAGATVADSPEIVAAMAAAAGNFVHFADALRQTSG